MENTTKITTKTYYVCGTCKQKMEKIKLGSGSDLFGISLTDNSAMYCDNKECEKFGYLTVAGVKKEE